MRTEVGLVMLCLVEELEWVMVMEMETAMARIHLLANKLKTKEAFLKDSTRIYHF